MYTIFRRRLYCGLVGSLRFSNMFTIPGKIHIHKVQKAALLETAHIFRRVLPTDLRLLYSAVGPWYGLISSKNTSTIKEEKTKIIIQI